MSLRCPCLSVPHDEQMRYLLLTIAVVVLVVIFRVGREVGYREGYQMCESQSEEGVGE